MLMLGSNSLPNLPLVTRLEDSSVNDRLRARVATRFGTAASVRPFKSASCMANSE